MVKKIIIIIITIIVTVTYDCESIEIKIGKPQRHVFLFSCVVSWVDSWPLYAF